MDIKARLLLPAAFLWFVAACGGGGGGGGETVTAAAQTATVSVVLTDASTEDYDQALATVTGIVLLGSDGPQQIFSGRETVDLLRLRDSYEFFAVADDVQPGRFEKIRLILSSLVLVRDDATGVEERIDVKLPGNGKLDLNPRGSFEIRAGELVAITLDVDMEKSLKFMTTGNGRVKIRPVVFVDIDTRPPIKKFTRIAGEIVRLFPDDQAFLLCRRGLVAQPDGGDPFSAPSPDKRICLDVLTDEDTGIFGPDGAPVDYANLMVGDDAIVAGRLGFRPEPDPDCGTGDEAEVCPLGNDDDALACPLDVDGCDPDSIYLQRILLNAFVVEQGGEGVFRRWRGVAQGDVDLNSNRFDFKLAPNQGLGGEPVLATQIYEKTRIFTRAGIELDASAIGDGQRAVIDAVLQLSNSDPDELRAALIILAPEADSGEAVLAGSVLTVDADNDSLNLSTSSGDRCVDVAADADIFAVQTTEEGLDNKRVALGELETGQLASLFGEEGIDGCFDANLILANVDP